VLEKAAGVTLLTSLYQLAKAAGQLGVVIGAVGMLIYGRCKKNQNIIQAKLFRILLLPVASYW